MILEYIFKKVFGSRNARLIKKLWPLVHQVTAFEEQYQKLTDDELRAKTQEFKQRLASGATLDDIMFEAFAAVKNACRRMVGREIEVTGHKLVWDMVPFDVQVMGGIVLHRCGITEMATGEGKTLVATMPLYLNALSGRNCQLVTVNDYLAMRDSEWMGAVFKFLGLTVGCIQNSMSPTERREHYACDITYGTNSEFGFDYLRDMGMAMSKEHMVQRDYYFAIIDEVDSILIDEARTPLIISGPAAVSTHRYDKLKPGVAELVRRQSLLCARLVQEAKEVLEKEGGAAEEEESAAILKLAQVRLGMPKQKQLMRLLEDPAIRKRVEKRELEFHSDSRRGWVQQVKQDLFFSMDERGGESDLTDKGRQHLRPDDPNAFVIPDVATLFSEIDADDALSDLDKAAKKRTIQEQFDVQSETLHNISQLLRAFCLFEKDVHYVVQDNKVLIVDEFTGRLMPGRRFSEGLHQALEAKEDVQIEGETQTLATVTIQNYFRMYQKLAGMTGTAETEANEFKQIYKLDVVVIPTNKPCVRHDFNDRIYKTKREKYNAIIEEIADCYERGQPVLVGTVSVEVSEVLSRLLQRRHIAHNVLNAKNHQSEAEIVARAGKAAAVTIATNMAGRGTDIKLGETVVGKGGLHVIGSERHDARRIDRQLRGRCARQGDPGSSRFYISLEDNLMRLFGSDRVASIMEKLGLQEGEELEHKLLNKSIERAQRRVEQQHFSIRKRTLEYDDVMNKQREVVYGLRRDILTTDEPRTMLFDFIHTAIMEKIEEKQDARARNEPLDITEIRDWLTRTFPIVFKPSDFPADAESGALGKAIVDRIDQAYQLKERTEDPSAIRWLERHVMLNAIDSLYQEHLYAMDDLRHGVQLRAYGQRDPLVEYKQEAYGMFADLMMRIKDQICSNVFRSATTLTAFQHMLASMPRQEVHDQLGQFGGLPTAGGGADGEAGANEVPLPAITIRRQMPKVGRNDPCPCGSGKKFKKCCDTQS
ncbi:MAG: preprotein translocase subunit SecA [Lentisphaerae bacterium RIFOXYB12_FULL_65_16]|nr:MAG: preprotein translocase subunit SecA [Lentisphaerae bacterium RIFOXYA12_64_32]OGV91220.1 MAG: preprotein translocase subunit SecA [Lentisphaerae bacterium RIFOXYB12_FULL_65_16]